MYRINTSYTIFAVIQFKLATDHALLYYYNNRGDQNNPSVHKLIPIERD